MNKAKSSLSFELEDNNREQEIRINFLRIEEYETKLKQQGEALYNKEVKLAQEKSLRVIFSNKIKFKRVSFRRIKKVENPGLL